MTAKPNLSIIGERIDQFISLDVPSRNVIHKLYPPARQKCGMPLTLAAAELIVERTHPCDPVFIATGWPDRPHITPAIAETDGPPGAAALARAVHRGLTAVPIILIEENLVSSMAKVIEASGLRVLSPEQAIQASSSSAPIHAAAVLGFPTDSDAAKARAAELLELYRPSAVISIEKGGMNKQGRVHTSRGHDTTEHMAKVDFLVLEAKARGIATIGIGDGGNEIGMGVIQDAIARTLPFGEQCLCGCGGGIAPSTLTDVLVTASISNWGAYGVAACLAAILGRPEVFHDAEVEERILLAAAASSFIDGISGYVEPSADGLPLSVHKAFVSILSALTHKALDNPYSE